MARREAIILGVILVAAAALRIFYNDVVVYSSADERVYLDYTRFLVEHGWQKYSEMVARYLADASSHIYPPPTRWGHFALTSTVCHLARECQPRTLAWLSTVAGVVSVGLTFQLATLWVSRRVGLIAAALCLSSPLQLALGRRALQDEVFCVAVLLSLITLTQLHRERSRRRALLAVLAWTFAFSIKETFFVIYPPLAVLIVFEIRRRGVRLSDLLVLGVPPLAYLAVFALLARSAGAFLDVTSIVAGASGAWYAAKFQSGPPHRIFLDLFTLAPVVFLLATAMVARQRERSPLVIFTVAVSLVFAVVPSKNVRYAIMLDPLLRLCAAVLLAELKPRLMYVVMALVAVSELALFYHVFVTGKLYDPVTDFLLRALGAIP